MKIRLDYVTNSSSSSFIIAKEHLKPKQIKKIYNHIHKANKKEMNGGHYPDEYAWRVWENETSIMMATDMDNFPMYQFLQLIGIEDRHIDRYY